MSDTFKVVIPAEFSKSENGEWKIAGLASTENMDQQGETIMQKGLDLSPIEQKKGFFNWDHDNSPENTIGVIDGYKKISKGLYVEGRLFKNHTKAKAIREIMESLGEGDHGRIGMSVEGKVLERDSKNPKIIKKCIIKNVALTMNPVNADTFTDIVKSLSADESAVEFDTNTKTFSEEDVVEIVAKALAISGGNAMAPAARTGGDALGQEELKDKEDLIKEDEKPVKKKMLPKKSKEEILKGMVDILDKLQVIYPDYPRTIIWEALRDRLTTTYDINTLNN